MLTSEIDPDEDDDVHLRVSSLVERLRASLFLVPMGAVVIAVAAGLGTLTIDSRLDDDGTDLPLGLASTVESARAVLSTIAGATIAFAGIAFSVSLLVIQLASSQFSPASCGPCSATRSTSASWPSSSALSRTASSSCAPSAPRSKRAANR